MDVKFRIPAGQRKALANKLAELTGENVRYLGVPSCAYQIGALTLSKDSALTIPDDFRDTEKLLSELERAGYESATSLTIEIPKDKVNLLNLRNLLDAKGALIRKALGIEALPIEERTETVAFPWFRDIDADSAKAYTHFISALCEMSLQSRVSSRPRNVANEKYTFRCFLLRLGFIGEQYKGERKILLRNLQGSSAFRDEV